jgi:hypothetical protein
VAFLDEDELQPSGPRSSGPERQRQLMVRRVIALGVGVLIIILLLLAVRGCLNARKERGFENYRSELEDIATQSNQLAAGFFDRLQNPPADSDPLTLEAQISSDRGTAEGLLQRVQDLDTPDELGEAQVELEQTFELRRDALAGIAEDISIALGDEGRDEAIDRIAGDMRAFLASDVLYAHAQHEINTELKDQQVSGQVPDSVFLPEPVAMWLDQQQLIGVLGNFATASGAIKGTHGLALLSTTIEKTPLTADADNVVDIGESPPTITVEVQNQGDQVENNVTVQYTLSGGTIAIEGEDAIARLDAQGIQDLKLPLEDMPDLDTPLTLDVEVVAVLGEQVADNNAATYTVTFN